MATVDSLETLSKDLLDGLDKLFGLHAGFRPVHAKGLLLSGTFKPAEAALLTRAPHAQAPSTPVTVRYSNFGGIPNISDTDPNAAPRGVAVRFHLGPHEHTDIIGHSHNGFPVRTGEEFLDFLKAANSTGKDTPSPTPLEQFMATHPIAKHFFDAPNPVPSSFSKESFFAVSAFKFVNKEGASCFGRFQILPDGGNEYLEPSMVAQKGSDFLFEEIDDRLKKGPIKLHIVVEMAGQGDDVNNASVTWPADRRKVEFGTIELTARVPDDDVNGQRLIFDPVPRVDGIEPSDDPLIELRAAIYLLSGRRRRAATK